MLADPHAWNAGSEVLAVRRTGTSWMGTLKNAATCCPLLLDDVDLRVEASQGAHRHSRRLSPPGAA